MPIDFSKYGVTDTPPPQGKRLIGVDFSKYEEPTFQSEVSQVNQRYGIAPTVDVTRSPLMKKIQQSMPIQGPPVPSSPNLLDKLNENVVFPISNFINRFAASAADAVTFGHAKPTLQKSPLFEQFTSPADTLPEKVADVGGTIFGSIAPIEGAYGTGGKLTAAAIERYAPNLPKLLKSGIRGLGAGAAYGTANQIVDAATGDAKPISERLLDVGKDALLFGTGDAAFSAAGSGINAARRAAAGGLTRAAEKDALERAIQNADLPITMPTDRIVTDAGIGASGTLAKQGDELAARIARQEEPTSARIERSTNPYTEKWNALVQTAQKESLPPGREYEALQDLWSRMAGPTDPSLDRLIELANPTLKDLERRTPTSAKLQRARELQGQMEVAGAPLPVKSEADRFGFRLSRTATTAAKQEVAPSVEGVAPTVERTAVESSVPTEQAMNLSKLRRTATAADAAQDYAGNIIPFRQATTQSERTINRNQVVKNLQKNVGVPIDTGRLTKSRGVAGQYKIQPEVVRTKRAEDLQVIAHEIGHHIDKKFGLSQPQFQQELISLLSHNPALNVAAYQPHQLIPEGVAEYVRLRLTDPSTASRLAPRFTQHLDQVLPAAVKQGLDRSARDIDTWITQGHYEQAKGLIDFESGTRKEPFRWDKLYTRMVDDLNPIKRAEETLKGEVGIGAESAYKMARLSRGVGERAKLAVTSGIYDAQGGKLSDGLAQLVRPLEDIGMSEKDFATYLAVKHAIDLKQMGKKVPFDDQQIAAVMGRWDSNPVVQTAQQNVIKWNDALLNLMVDSGLKRSQDVAAMRAKYPNYVPFFRYFEDDAVASFKNGGYGASRGFANITDPVKHMSEEGSLRTIINPIESMVKNAFLVMNAVAKNKVGQQLAELSKIDGSGTWIEHVGPGGASPHEHVIAVWQQGERQAFKIRDPDLYNAVLSLDNESSNSLIKFLGGAASILRAGATLTPEFTIRNAMRDILGAMVNSTKYGFNPVDWIRGLFAVIGKNELFDQFITSGGAMGTMISLDREANREALQAVFRKSLKDKALNVVTDPKELAKFLSGYTPLKTVVGGLRKAAEVSELSTRVGAFQKTLRKTGSVEEAAYTARDLMDFNRAGSAVRQANKAIAFLNAGIQGVDRFARAFKDNPASFLTRAGVTLVLPAAAAYMWNEMMLSPEEKKTFDNIPQWQKDTFFVIGIPGTGEFVRIPKPFEAGMLFATGTERALRWLKENDPDAFRNYGKATLEALTPPMLFSAFTPLLEAITNHSFFRNASIVPVGEQRLEKKDQYNLYTSETAKLIGQGLSKTPLEESNFASPRIIDNTIKGYTAGLGQYAVEGIDAAIKGLSRTETTPEPAKRPTEVLLARSFFVNTGGGGQVREDFYDKWDDLSKAKASADKNGQQFSDPDYLRMKNAKSAMDKLLDQYRGIQKSKLIKSEDKRRQLDDLDKKMNDLAEFGLTGRKVTNAN